MFSYNQILAAVNIIVGSLAVSGENYALATSNLGLALLLMIQYLKED